MKIAAAASATPVPVSEQDRLGSIALDQWRGLALVLVLISHGFYFTDRVNGIGRVGVNLFFFISGVLVFRSLSRTRAATGWERTRAFWWRRFRRLYPAMITYALAMLPVAWWMQHRPGQVGPTDIEAYLKSLPVVMLYGTNYVSGTAPMALRHLWSLACEMQFYFLAPFLYWLGGQTDRRRRAVFGPVLALLMLLGAAQPFIYRWHPNFWQYNFEFTSWPMMLGFCCEYQRPAFQRISPVLVTWIFRSCVAICAVTLPVTIFYREMKLAVIATGALLLGPCLLAYLFGRPIPGAPGRAMKWLGERTYSIYLWQQPFTLCNYLPNLWHPAGAAIAVAVGNGWFRLFERPFLSAGRRRDGHPMIRKKSAWWKWGGLALTAIVAAMLMAFGMARARYERHLRSQIWPAAAPEVSVFTGATGGSKPTVMLLGDSRMSQWGLPQLARWRVVNAGVGGATTGQIRLLAPGLLAEVHPDVVVIQEGINDLKFLGLRPGMAPDIVSLATSNLVAVVNECSRQNCRVLVLETWPAGKPSLARRLVWSAAIPASVNQFNLRLQTLNSPPRGVLVVDLFGQTGLVPGAQSYVDTLHFTTETYAQLTPALERDLDLLLLPGK